MQQIIWKKLLRRSVSTRLIEPWILSMIQLWTVKTASQLCRLFKTPLCFLRSHLSIHTIKSIEIYPLVSDKSERDTFKTTPFYSLTALIWYLLTIQIVVCFRLQSTRDRLRESAGKTFSYWSRVSPLQDPRSFFNPGETISNVLQYSRKGLASSVKLKFTILFIFSFYTQATGYNHIFFLENNTPSLV